MVLAGRKLAVALPDTVLEEKESPRDKTTKLGIMARVCAIYGVDVIEVFRDPRGAGEGAQIQKVLEYLETPQYLRKRLFPIDEELRYAGVLPPLRIPSHRGKVPLGSLQEGEFLEGVMNGDGTVEVGLEVPLQVRGKARQGGRVTVRVASTRPLSVEVVQREGVNRYWGYRVEQKGANEVFSDPRYDLKIATSRLGKGVGAAMHQLEARYSGARAIKIAFGSPSRGLYDIYGEGLDKKADLVLNLFPEQNVETVRTEEALSAGLGLLSLIPAINP